MGIKSQDRQSGGDEVGPSVLVVISGLGPGGAERVVSRIVNHWASQGRKVGLLTLTTLDSDHYEIDARVQRIGLDIVWPSANYWQGLLSTLRRLRLIRKAISDYAPDVVLSLIDRTNLLVLLSLVGSGITTIVSERTDPRHHDIGRVRNLVRRIVYPLAAAVVVQTESVAEWARTVVAAKKIAVIPNPIGTLPEPKPLPSRSRSVIAVGRLTAEKGFDNLIRAFAESQLPALDWQLNILGEGPERARLEGIIETEALSSKVHLVGLIKQPWTWLNEARVFVLSSRYEGFPNALLEAMAMGCACIATDCQSGPGEIIEDGQTGKLIPTEDIAALAKALNDLKEESDTVVAMSTSALEVRHRFALDRVMTQWDDLIAAKLAG